MTRSRELNSSLGKGGSVVGGGITMKGLEKVYPGDVHAVRGVSLEIKDGEFITLLGPSGSGKSTLLMLLGGFTAPTAGRIFQDDAEITGVPAENRNFGVVFQSYALFPHMTVRNNLAYPLKVRRIARHERNKMVRDAIDLVGLEGMENRRPAQLSGGQQQRVALARALVYRPSVLLLDEPLGALDRALRERMQTELRRLHRETGVTFLYVTHDQEEALTMSDRVVVLRQGEIEQIGTPQDLYDRPHTEFVATFVGTANRLQGNVLEVGSSSARIQFKSGHVADVSCAPGSLEPQSPAVVVVRPEKIKIFTDSNAVPDGFQIPGAVEDVVFAGNIWRYRIRTDEGEIEVHSATASDVEAGAPVQLHWSASDAWAIEREAKPEILPSNELEAEATKY